MRSKLIHMPYLVFPDSRTTKVMLPSRKEQACVQPSGLEGAKDHQIRVISSGSAGAVQMFYLMDDLAREGEMKT